MLPIGLIYRLPAEPPRAQRITHLTIRRRTALGESRGDAIAQTKRKVNGGGLEPRRTSATGNVVVAQRAHPPRLLARGRRLPVWPSLQIDSAPVFINPH